MITLTPRPTLVENSTTVLPSPLLSPPEVFKMIEKTNLNDDDYLTMFDDGRLVFVDQNDSQQVITKTFLEQFVLV